MVKKAGGYKIFAVSCLIPAWVFFIHISCVFAEEQSLIINIAGDVRLDGYIWEKIQSYGYEYPFERIKDILDMADINCVNLECAVSTKGEPQDKKFTFRAEPESLNTLKKSGIGFVVVANNHTYDYGEEAFIDTLANLDFYGIRHVGGGADITQARKPAIFEIKNKRTAFLAYSNMFPAEQWAKDEKSGVSPAYLKNIKEDVAKAKKESDYVFVVYHGGIERSYDVKQVQRDIAYTAIDSGADAVFGHHSHRLGGLEFYKGKLICFSLGNFLFLSPDKESYKTMIMQIRIDSGLSYYCYPLVISDAFVKMPDESQRKEIFDLLEEISDKNSVLLNAAGDKAEVRMRK